LGETTSVGVALTVRETLMVNDAEPLTIETVPVYADALAGRPMGFTLICRLSPREPVLPVRLTTFVIGVEPQA
jgi:hypothetical protein